MKVTNNTLTLPSISIAAKRADRSTTASKSLRNVRINIFDAHLTGIYYKLAWQSSADPIGNHFDDNWREREPRPRPATTGRERWRQPFRSSSRTQVVCEKSRYRPWYKYTTSSSSPRDHHERDPEHFRQQMPDDLACAETCTSLGGCHARHVNERRLAGLPSSTPTHFGPILLTSSLFLSIAVSFVPCSPFSLPPSHRLLFSFTAPIQLVSALFLPCYNISFVLFPSHHSPSKDTKEM